MPKSMPKSELTIDDFLTVPEAAERKGVGLTTLYRAVQRNELPVLRMAGLLFILPADIDAYNPRFLRRRRLRARRAARQADTANSQ